MADGNISDRKVVRMASFLARHLGDLDSDAANDYLDGKGDPTAGQVSYLLWGGDISKTNRTRALKWAKKQSEAVKEEKSSYPLFGWQEPTVKFLGLPTVKHYRSEIKKKNSGKL